jgi:hypothetical protein
MDALRDRRVVPFQVQNYDRKQQSVIKVLLLFLPFIHSFTLETEVVVRIDKRLKRLQKDNPAVL